MNWLGNFLSRGKKIPGADPIETLVDEASGHYRTGGLSAAEAACEKVLRSRPDHPTALFLAGNIALDRGDNEKAIEHLRRAVAGKATDAEFHYMLGYAFQAAGQTADAMNAYRTALRINPRYPKAYNNLGLLLEAENALEEAADCYRKALECDPGLAQAHHNYGNVLRRQSRLDEAVEAYRRALALQPACAEWHENLGNVLSQLGKPDEAIACHETAVTLNPNYTDAYCAMGDACFATGDQNKAIECFHKALEINPESVSALYGLGTMYLEQRVLERAEAYIRKALALDPEHIDAHAILGDVLLNQGRSQEALASYLNVLQRDPNSMKAHNNIGTIYEEQGRLDDALEAYRTLLQLAPQHVAAHTNMGNVFQKKGQLADAVESYRKALEIKPDLAMTRSNLLLVLNYIRGDDPEYMFKEHLEWARQQAGATADDAACKNDRSVDRRLRVGYVSADFRRHSVAYFIEPILARHDRSRFEVYCYSDVLRADETTERLRGLTDHWNNISRLSDDEVVDLVREDEIDVLVDLSGHTGRNRMTVFARRVAPVQVTYIGYPNTTGLPTIDYRFTDAVSDPEGVTESYYTEELLRLPHGFLCFQPPVNGPDGVATPCLSKGFVTFASFNNLSKLSAETIDLWAKILRAAPGSRLLLKSLGLSSPDAQIRVLDQFEHNGIGKERLDVRGMVPEYLDHLRLYNDADIALDVYPYNGTTTTCEALWMGVPVITLAGKTHVSRVGASLLHQIGLDELVATHPEDYVARALELASDPARLASLRSSLRQKMQSSALCDAPAFTRALEDAYRRMWRNWCCTIDAAGDSTHPGERVRDDSESPLRIEVEKSAQRPRT